MKKIHLIGNAHLDPVWLWQWQEGFAEIKATFRSVLDRMNEFKNFKFASACAAYYMWIEKSDPAMFAEIQKRVNEGRWNITGGWLIQPDCNMPSGESFARQALIGQRYFKEKFGVTAHTGYNVDSFGHNGNLPQILKKSGMDNYVFMRPMPDEKELPSYLFDWESADNSRVRTYRIPDVYNIDISKFDEFEKIKNIPQPYDMMAFYGVGNHGGGPTIELLDRMKRELTDDYVYSSPDEYFEAVKDETVPVVHDDLQYHSKGCYSALTQIKSDNRKCENMLYRSEAFCVMSSVIAGTCYPQDELKKAWLNVLFNQFHDTLCGCAVPEAYDDAAYQLGETMSIASRNTEFALQQISWNIDTMNGKSFKPYKPDYPPLPSWRNTQGIGTPVVVFNSLAYPVRAAVSVRDMPGYVTDNDGNIIPFQAVRDSKINGTKKYKIAFWANVPALGYTVYRMFFDDDKTSPETDLRADGNVLENSRVKVVFDDCLGEISYVTDKTNGKRIVLPGSCALLIDEEMYDTWAHGANDFKQICAKCTEGSIHITENGPVRVTMRCEQSFENTHIIRDYSLTPQNDEITVNCRIDFREKHKMLKFAVPTGGQGSASVCGIPFGFISRPNDGAEQVSGSWISLGNAAIATDSKYSFDADGNILSLTVLRGAVYADHFGQNLRDEFCEYMEQGIHKFTYMIFPYNNPADAAVRAQKMNNAPTAITETFHTGRLGTEFSAISVSKPNIIVTAIKKHEDSQAWVIRCYEADNCDTDVVIKIFDTEFNDHFAANEIKTFIFSHGEVMETNFVECKI